MPASIRNTLDLGYLPRGRLTYIALPIGLVVYAAAILTLPLLQADEQIAVTLLLLTPVLLICVYVVTRAILGDRLSGTIIAVACIFMIAAVFRSRDYDDKSIDWQVGMKLVALALLFGMVVVFMSYAFNRLHLGRLFYAWLLFFAWLVVSSLYAVSVVFALVCSFSLLISYLYAVYMTVWLSRIRAIEIMMLVALLMCLGSIFVYYAVPSIGRMQGWIPGAQAIGDVGRMKGLSGSANGIGMIAAYAITVVVLYYRELGVFSKPLAILLLPSALACLILAHNRASMLAIAVAIWFASVCRRDTNLKLMLSITGALAGGVLLMSFSDEIFSMVSRSGRTEEITSMTGRTSIWAVVIELWSQRPFLGYGYTSAVSILPLDPRLFHVAAHTHNMFLSLLFGGGIVMIVIFIYATYLTFLQMYRLRAINEAALFIFELVRGLTEAGPFGMMTGYTSIAVSVTIALVISRAIDARAKAPATRPLTSTRAAPRLRPSRA